MSGPGLRGSDRHRSKIRELPSVTPPSSKDNVSVSRSVAQADHTSDVHSSEARGVGKYAGFRGRRRHDAVRTRLVRATVYLLPDKLALIQQNCADTNRRISDLISEAIEDYLRKSRRAAVLDRASTLPAPPAAES